MTKRQKTTLLLEKSYLTVIKNSLGTKMFRSFYTRVGGKNKDLLKNGELSCAYFVSSILFIFGLIGKIHLTVKSTIEDMKKSGWKSIKKPKPGSVIVWQAKKIGKTINKHIGFYIGRGRAISNNWEKKQVIVHHWTYNNQRRIEKIFWHKNLGKGRKK